jgi:hypothetical protein
MRLTKTPDIRTNRRLGSHVLFSYKKPYIFALCDIPANMSPNPKIAPMKKYMIVLKNLLNLFLSFETKKKTKGSTEAPTRNCNACTLSGRLIYST